MEATVGQKIWRIAIIIAMPFFLGLFMMQLVIGWNWPNFPTWEYGRIAPDQFGFSEEERLDLALSTLSYLRQPERAEDVITMLETLRISDTGEPLYNEREIGHMLDVKIVADNIRFVWVVSMVIVLVGTLYMVVKPTTKQFGWRTIMYGGIFTVAVLLGIALFIVLAWDSFFTTFHELLFPAGTWTFAYSDGLIRLFPEQFWFDVGIIMSVGALLLGVLVALFGYLMARRTA